MNIGFLGLGRMGLSLASSLKKREEHRLLAFDPAGTADLTSTKDAAALEEACDILFLCVKPDQLQDATRGLRGHKSYLSILAGISLAQVQSALGKADARTARLMPNICASSNHSVNALFCPDPELRKILGDLLTPSGSVIFIEHEKDMHAVTALSGSGPAYVALFIQALAEGGVRSGLPYTTALSLARETVAGTAAHLSLTGEHPEVLRNQVTSAGGTTIAGLLALEEGAVRAAIIQAVERASRRSMELG